MAVLVEPEDFWKEMAVMLPDIPISVEVYKIRQPEKVDFRFVGVKKVVSVPGVAGMLTMVGSADADPVANKSIASKRTLW